jgi:hypothetical protein
MWTRRCSGCGSRSTASSDAAREALVPPTPARLTPGDALAARPPASRVEVTMSGEVGGLGMLAHRVLRPFGPLALLALLLLLLAPAPGGAQQDSAPRPPQADSARVVGGVRSALNGLPLQGIMIAVRGTHRSDVTDSAGAFAVSDLPSGDQVVRIQYGDTLFYDKGIHLARGKTLVLAVLLAPALEVTPVVVEARSLLADLSLAGFYERRSGGIGRFYTYDQLEQSVPRSIHVLLLQAGVTVQCVRSRCLPFVVSGSGRCVLSVYLDAVPLSPDQVEAFPPDELAALEIYRRATDIPAQFHRRQEDCGAILMWRRR